MKEWEKPFSSYQLCAISLPCLLSHIFSLNCSWKVWAVELLCPAPGTRLLRIYGEISTQMKKEFSIIHFTIVSPKLFASLSLCRFKYIGGETTTQENETRRVWVFQGRIYPWRLRGNGTWLALCYLNLANCLYISRWLKAEVPAVGNGPAGKQYQNASLCTSMATK